MHTGTTDAYLLALMLTFVRISVHRRHVAAEISCDAQAVELCSTIVNTGTKLRFGKRSAVVFNHHFETTQTCGKPGFGQIFTLALAARARMHMTPAHMAAAMATNAAAAMSTSTSVSLSSSPPSSAGAAGTYGGTMVCTAYGPKEGSNRISPGWKGGQRGGAKGVQRGFDAPRTARRRGLAGSRRAGKGERGGQRGGQRGLRGDLTVKCRRM
eukprot:108735-Prorocentrum_minimum.AAC.1